jgi:NACalpha-BTF3-like transcription factor
MKFDEYKNSKTKNNTTQSFDEYKKSKNAEYESNRISQKIKKGKRIYDNSINFSDKLNYSNSSLQLPKGWNENTSGIIEKIGNGWTEEQKNNYYYMLTEDRNQAKDYARYINALGRINPKTKMPFNEEEALKITTNLKTLDYQSAHPEFYAKYNIDTTSEKWKLNSEDHSGELQNPGENSAITEEKIKYVMEQEDLSREEAEEYLKNYYGEDYGGYIYPADFVAIRDKGGKDYTEFLSYIHVRDVDRDYKLEGTDKNLFNELEYSAEQKGYDYASPEEIKTLRYIINTGTEEEADEYWNALKIEMSKECKEEILIGNLTLVLSWKNNGNLDSWGTL